MNTNNRLSRLILALSISIGFKTYGKDDSLFIQNEPRYTGTTVRLVFTNNAKQTRYKVNLEKIALIKIEYVANDGSKTPQIVREAELIMIGNSNRARTLNTRTLNFKRGSKVTIYSADLYDNKGTLLGSSSLTQPDVFVVARSQGKSVMERTYSTVAVELIKMDWGY